MGISFLKTVNTLQVALQKHKGGDGLFRVGVRVRGGSISASHDIYTGTVKILPEL